MLLGLALGAGSCKSAEQQAAAADKEVYALIEERRAALGSEDRPFTIEPNPNSLRRKLERGEVGVLEPLTLAQCLEIAAENSRDFQTQRENFYLSALDLTLERYRFRVQTVGAVGAFLSGDGHEATTAGGDAGFGFTKLLGTGAAIIGNIGMSVARDLTRADGWDLITDVGMSITQPLLAGSDPDIVREPLTQAERNVVYSARNYERFRRTYAVDVASRVYRILQQGDQVKNEEVNYENLKALREKNDALADSGRLSQLEVDQAKQDELNSLNRLVEERRNHETLIDSFKLFLGLPVPIQLAIDPAELSRLEGEQLKLFDIDFEKLDELALGSRLDYLSTLDRVDDSLRDVNVAADALRARMNLSSSFNAASDPGKPLEFNADNVDWTARIDADLALDRFPERNNYREALIRVNAARRDAEDESDSIRAQIRALVREAQAAYEGYEIQKLSVTLAERRVEREAMNQDAGRATTRDILEAQEALLGAKNSLTAALINYQISRLALFRDLELLRVDEEGVRFDLAPLEGVIEPQAQPPEEAPNDPDNPAEQRP